MNAGTQINMTQSAITILSSSAIFAVIAHYALKKSVGWVIGAAVLGAGIGFFIDTKIQTT